MIHLLVTAVRTERIDVSSLGSHGGVSDVVQGRTSVEFEGNGGVGFDLDWTYRSDPVPAVGSRWTLAPKETA